MHTWQVFCTNIKGRKVFLTKQGLYSCPVCVRKGVSLFAPAVFFLPVTFELLGQFYANLIERRRFRKYSVPMAFVKNSAWLEDRVLINASNGGNFFWNKNLAAIAIPVSCWKHSQLQSQMRLLRTSFWKPLRCQESTLDLSFTKQIYWAQHLWLCRSENLFPPF